MVNESIATAACAAVAPQLPHHHTATTADVENRGNPTPEEVALQKAERCQQIGEVGLANHWRNEALLERYAREHKAAKVAQWKRRMKWGNK